MSAGTSSSADSSGASYPSYTEPIPDSATTITDNLTYVCYIQDPDIQLNNLWTVEHWKNSDVDSATTFVYKVCSSLTQTRGKVWLDPVANKDRMSSYFKYMILQDSIESHIKSNRSLQVYHLRYSLKVAKVEVISSDVSQQTHKRSDIGETTSKKFESHLSCLCEYHKSLKSR